jgi:hypothetical protein
MPRRFRPSLPATVLDAFLNGYNLGDDDGGSGPTMLDAVPEIMRSVSAEDY